MKSKTLIGVFLGCSLFGFKAVAGAKLFKRDAEARVVLNLVKKYLPENPVILEAGAHNGGDTVILAQTWPKGRVHAFEPQPLLAEQLKLTTKKYPNVQCYQIGLSNTDGEALFYDSEHDFEPGRPFASGSLLEPKIHLKYSPHVKFNKQFMVPITTINAWAKQNDVSQVDFMWLDLQGMELPALQAATDLLSKVKVIYTEVEFVEAYKGQSLYRDIKKWLETQGFELMATDFTAKEEQRPSIERWYGNAIFVKKQIKPVDFVIFSYDRPMQLYALLESADQHLTGCASTTVIYRATPQYQAGYDLVQKQFNDVSFMRQQKPPHDFKQLVKNAAFAEGQANYVLFAVDDLIIKEPVDLASCADLLEKHNAYSFLLRLGKNIDYCYMLSQNTSVPPSEQVSPTVYKYCFAAGKGDWAYPNNLDMSLYRKADIYKTIMALNWNCPNHFEGMWAGYANLNQSGLFFEKSKIVNVPINKVHQSSNRFMNSYSMQELLTKFLAGEKIDIAALAATKHKSVHIDYNVTFVPK